MPANTTHPDFDAIAADWSRARDVLTGEDAVRRAGERYLPRLDSQSDEEYAAYRQRASFFNGTARTAEGYIGLIFRRPPFIKLPELRVGNSESRMAGGLPKALAGFVNDADMLGTPLAGYAKNVVSEVVAVGRAGSLVDWESVEGRAYVSLYSAEQILNWRVERVNGRNIPTLVVLSETVIADDPEDSFEIKALEQIRVLRLVDNGSGEPQCIVELWRPKETRQKRAKVEWELVETKTPVRLGKPCKCRLTI